MLKVTMMKAFSTLMTLAVACAGCVSYPFIDDSIAKLDATPVNVAAKFKLPETPPQLIEPQAAEKLVGTWSTGVQHSFWRHISESGTITDVDAAVGGSIIGEVYVFSANGDVCHTDVRQVLGVVLLTFKDFGTWTYKSGELTLRYKKREGNTQDLVAKVNGASNYESAFTEKIDMVETCRVEWFANNEIAIMRNDKKQSSQSDTERTIIKVDAYGVRTEREIKVMDMRDGRETGSVSEKIYPPMHFKKNND